MPDYKKHETKSCPRCDVEFECKSNSILLCQCQTIYLTPEQTDFVSKEYDDCLCVSCLQALRREYNYQKHQTARIGHDQRCVTRPERDDLC